MREPGLINPEPHFPLVPEPGGPARGAVPWTAWDVFAIVGLVIGVYILMSVVLGTLLSIATIIDANVDMDVLIDSPVANSLMWLLQWCVTLGVAFTYLKVRGYPLNLPVLGFRATRPGRAALLIIGVLFVSFFFQGIYVQYIVPEQEQVTNLFGTSLLSFIVAMVIVAVLTPVVEELFFRGIIHRGLEQRFGFVPGAAVSSFIFALAHFDPTVYIPIFVLGFGFAWLVHRTGSVWPAIAAHFLWNTLGVVAQFFTDGS